MGVNYNPKIVTDGLVLALDAANPKSFSPNVHPYPTDIYGWVQNATAATLSRDTISSPVGNTPLKMVQSGNDPYTNSYSGESGRWRLAPAATGQTWTVSVLVKASQAIQIEGCWIASLDASGNYLAGGGSPNPTIGTDWTRISGTYTHSHASTAFVGIRLDGTPSGGSGVTVWWDGLQVELASAATTFNPKVNTNRTSWWDISSSNIVGALTDSPAYQSGALNFDGVNDYVSANIPSFFTSYSQQITIETWINVPASATWNNAYEGVIVGRGNYGGSHGLFRSLTNNRINAWFRQSGATYGAFSASGNITRDSWNQCVAIWTGVSAQLYINGSLAQTSNGTLGSTTSDQAFIIGGNNTAGGATASYFTGRIAGTKIYNRALTANEVLQNFNATRSRFGI